jgi:hypothetical protein
MKSQNIVGSRPPVIMFFFSILAHGISCPSGTFSVVNSTHPAGVCNTCSTCSIGQYVVTNCSNAANVVCRACTNPLQATHSTRYFFTGIGYSGEKSCPWCCLGGMAYDVITKGCWGIGTNGWAQCGIAYGCPINSKGRFQNQISQGNCMCNLGFYGNAAWADTWNQFPVNTQLQPPVNWSGVNCEACPTGKYANSLITLSSQCVSCLAGTYSASVASSSATQCTSCDPGKYSSTTGASNLASCTLCQPGTFSTKQGATVCTSCPGGTFSKLAGALNVSVCLNCTAGNYSDGGATECIKCDAGFTSLEASSVCTLIPPCPLGFYGLNPNCNPCPPHTNTSINHTSTLLDCRCLPGFVCTYTKRINLRLTLMNITWDMLDITGLANSRVIDAIASAAGVSKDNVVITGIVHGTTGRGRRLMRDWDAPPHLDLVTPQSKNNEVKTVSIWVTIIGAIGLNDALVATLLDQYFVDSFSWTHGHSVKVARERV